MDDWLLSCKMRVDQRPAKVMSRTTSTERTAMKNLRPVLVALTVSVVLGSYIALAQQPAAPAQGAGQCRGAPGGGRGPTGRCRSSSPACRRVTARITVVWPAPTHTASSLRLLQVGAKPCGTPTSALRAGRGQRPRSHRQRPLVQSAGQRVARTWPSFTETRIDQARMGNALGKQISLSEKGTV